MMEFIGKITKDIKESIETETYDVSGAWNYTNGLASKGFDIGLTIDDPTCMFDTHTFAIHKDISNTAGTIQAKVYQGGLIPFGESDQELAYANSVVKVKKDDMVVGDTLTMVSGGVSCDGSVATLHAYLLEKTDDGFLQVIGEVINIDDVEVASALLVANDDSTSFEIKADKLKLNDVALGTMAFAKTEDYYTKEQSSQILPIEVTESRALTQDDCGKLLICTGVVGVDLTLPISLQGFNCKIKNETTAIVNIVEDGTTVSGVLIIAQDARAEIMPRLVADTYDLF